MSDTAPPPAVGSVVGDNKAPFVEIWDQQNQTLLADLTKNNAAMIKLRDDLAARFAKVPEVLETQEQHDEAAQLVSDITKAVKAIDAGREHDKAPTLQAGRLIDTHYAGLKVPEEDAKKKTLARITDFQNRKAAEERRLREETERLAREKAAEDRRKAEELAQAAQTERDLRVAIESDKIAKRSEVASAKATAAVDAKPADLVRTRTATGALSTMKKETVVVVDDYAEVDLNGLRAYIPQATVDAALRAMFRANPKAEIEGARYIEREVAVVR